MSCIASMWCGYFFIVANYLMPFDFFHSKCVYEMQFQGVAIKAAILALTVVRCDGRLSLILLMHYRLIYLPIKSSE